MKSGASTYEAFSIAIASLRSAKLRSFLTLLGIILSTTTLIAVMAVIHGMDVYVAEKIADLGADSFVVTRFAFFGDFEPKKYLELMRRNPELRQDEFEFLKQRTTLVREICIRSSTQADVSVGNQRLEDVGITGGSANMNILQNVQTESGRYFSESENLNHRSVAFIGADLKEKFFANVDPVGKTIDIAGRPFTVVGVAKKMGSVFGQSQDNFADVPVYTFFKMFGSRRWISFTCQALDQQHFQQAMDEVRSLLRAYRGLPPGREDNFTVFNSESIMGAWDRLTGAIAATAMAVVSVFMVVGGVVIMNIMLAVVTERTNEIGVRKSLGARRSDILRQFLVESAVLSGAGGLAGVLIAWAVAVLVRTLTPVPMELPVSSIVVGVGLSATVGLFFGIYPAQKASKLDPIEALRAEK
ncbi:MAG: ABC transporter permease [Acidobacteria bacterium]|nr:ABC transporter permease [Acidobacteriota bacterium]